MSSVLSHCRLIFILLFTSFTSFAQQYDESGYYLLPGENALKKIKDNLFVKLFVDKRNCFVGEPVVATFKLFSRLQSSSDIVKNPGFYGFSVHDMINLDDKVKTTERINGKDFDVHTIRKVQLYPLQAGRFTIDEMQIENKVEFSKSFINKKTEQEVTEGVLDNADESAASPDMEIYKTSLHTEPVIINVNPLPEKNKPENFNGAAGQFSIRANLSKGKLARNEEGILEILIEGNGNFTQLIAPLINWPKELEGFSPSVKDILDKRQTPLSGARIFRYPFISSAPGKWIIPDVKFSFYNTKKQQYETISTNSIGIKILEEEFKKINEVVVTNKKSIEETNRKASRIALIIVAGLFIVAVGYWFLFGNKKAKTEGVIHEEAKQISAEEYFLPLQNDRNEAGQFHKDLYGLTWKYLSEKYLLAGTAINKARLEQIILQQGNSPEQTKELIDLLNRLETAMYTTVSEDESTEIFVKKIVDALNSLKS